MFWRIRPSFLKHCRSAIVSWSYTSLGNSVFVRIGSSVGFQLVILMVATYRTVNTTDVPKSIIMMDSILCGSDRTTAHIYSTTIGILSSGLKPHLHYTTIIRMTQHHGPIIRVPPASLATLCFMILQLTTT
jgi:hypothetical protein